MDLYTITLFTPRHTDEGARTGSFCHSCFLRSKTGSWDFHKVGSLLPRSESKRAINQMVKSNFEPGGFQVEFQATSLETDPESVAPDITSECF